MMGLRENKTCRFALVLPVVAGLVVLFLAGCGGAASEAQGESAPAVEMPHVVALTDLPYASALVVADEDADADTDADIVRGLGRGIRLSDMTEEDFSRDSSFAMCQVANDFRSALSEAAVLDTLLCYAKQTLPSMQSEGWDLYSIEPNNFSLRFGSTGQTVLVRTLIRRRAGRIEKFQMWTCEEGEQTGYVQQEIAGNVFTMRGKFLADDRAHLLTVSGTLDADNQFLTKAITSQFQKTWSDGQSYGERTLTLMPEEATLSRWDKGYWTAEGRTVPFQNVAFASFELLGGDLESLAVGDGALRGESRGGQGVDTFVESIVEGWNGTTFARDITSERILEVENEPAPNAGSEPDLSFSGEEAFNCLGQKITINVNEAEVGIFCSDQQLDEEWLNCWDVVKNGAGGGNVPEESVMGETCVTFTDCDSLGSGAVCVAVPEGRVCSLICDSNADCTAYGDFVCGAESVCEENSGVE